MVKRYPKLNVPGGWRDETLFRSSKCKKANVRTIHSNYRQVVLSSTLHFLLAFALDGLPELGSSLKEIFLVAPFETSTPGVQRCVHMRLGL